MNWKKAAIDDLRKYPIQKNSLENIRIRIRALQEQYTSFKGATLDSTPVSGGGSRMEDRLLDNIVERQRLAHTYKAARRLVTLVERGLNDLDDKERLVLERFFIHRHSGHVERLMDEMGYEQAQVYRVKEDALYKFTICMYGLSDY